MGTPVERVKSVIVNRTVREGLPEMETSEQGPKGDEGEPGGGLGSAVCRGNNRCHVLRGVPGVFREQRRGQ